MTEIYDWTAHDKWEKATRSQIISQKDAERRRAHGELYDATNQQKEHGLETLIAGLTTCIPAIATISSIPYANENIANAALTTLGAIATAFFARYTILFYQRYDQSKQETQSAQEYLERVNREFTSLLLKK